MSNFSYSVHLALISLKTVNTYDIKIIILNEIKRGITNNYFVDLINKCEISLFNMI